MSVTLSKTPTADFVPSAPSSSRQVSGRDSIPVWLAQAIVNSDLNAFVFCSADAVRGQFIPSAIYLMSTHASEELEAAATPPEAQTPPLVQTASAMAKDIVDRLGFPITALADALDIERKTIYDWFKGAEASPDNAARLSILANAFKDEPDGALRFYHRFWKRLLSTGSSLREVLTSSSLDVSTVRRAMAELREAAIASMASDRTRARVALSEGHGSGALSDYLQVGVRE